MPEQILTSAFIIALLSATGVHLWLATRHLHHVARHREQVPDAFGDRISLDEHQKAADYTMAKVRLARVDYVVGAALTLLWTVGGGVRLLDSLSSVWLGDPFLAGLGLLLAAFIIMATLDLPFAIYRTFVLEARFGFNRMTAKLYITDLIKQLALFLAIGGPIAALALFLMERMGEFWWIYLWAAWLALSLTLMWLYPTYIAPLFNKFTPLQDPALRERIESLLQRNGFASSGIFVMDGSKRSGHGNAYFTGLGGAKRIVFFDTLLKSLSPPEIEAVLAHEVGHFKRRHITKQIAVSAIIALLALALLGVLSTKPWFYSALGAGAPSTAKALLLFMLVLPVFTFFLQPLGAWFSRRHEFEADEFAAGQANADDLVRALVKLYKENANTLTPDPLFSAFHDSHPPAPVRIAHLRHAAQTN